MSTEVPTESVQRETRRKRVRRLKQIIVGTLITAILFPSVLCVLLFIKTARLEAKINELQGMLERQEETMQCLQTKQEQKQEQEQGEERLSVEEEVPPERNPAETVSGNSAGTEEVKVRNVYLTFDDGPSIYTGEILDILKEYDVKATFFVTGKEGKKYEALYRRIADEGHTLGMHSYSHKYSEIYESKESFAEDFTKLQDYLYELTGVESRLYRFPGGSGNTVSHTDMGEFIEYLKEQGVVYFDWNVSSGDASGKTLSVEQIVDNCTENMDYYNSAFILLHDSKEKHTTVEALPIVIEKILATEHTQIVPITEETVPVQQRKN